MKSLIKNLALLTVGGATVPTDAVRLSMMYARRAPSPHSASGEPSRSSRESGPYENQPLLCVDQVDSTSTQQSSPLPYTQQDGYDERPDTRQLPPIMPLEEEAQLTRSRTS